VPKCLHQAALDFSRGEEGPFEAIVLQNPELRNCPSAPNRCALCARAIALVRARKKGGPAIDQQFADLGRYATAQCHHG
jgi:hypothetical protein